MVLLFGLAASWLPSAFAGEKVKVLMKTNLGDIVLELDGDKAPKTVDNFVAYVNFRSKDVRGWGYAVFGRVVQGMDVVDKIAAQPTQSLSNGMRNVPVKAVVIEKVVALGGDSEKGK